MRHAAIGYSPGRRSRLSAIRNRCFRCLSRLILDRTIFATGRFIAMPAPANQRLCEQTSSSNGTIFVAEMEVEPEGVRRERADMDVVIAEIMRSCPSHWKQHSRRGPLSGFLGRSRLR